MIPEKKELMDEIILVTTMIREQCPEIYRKLSETPLFLSPKNDTVAVPELKHYLESLRLQYNLFEKDAL
jgi:hypothetical protein